MKTILTTLLSLGLAMTVGATFAEESGYRHPIQHSTASVSAPSTSDQAKLKAGIERAQKKLHMTFTGVAPEFLGPGPIPGLFEMIVGGRLIYYYPDKNWLLFGEFYTAEGISETQRRLSELQMAKIKDLPLDQAITVGNGPNDVIEFVDPDCPFCKKWEAYAQKRQDLTRHIFLVPLDSLHPTARGKAEHVLCAADPGKTLGDFLTGRIGTNQLKTCKEGQARLKVHEGAARKLGVTGTPTLVINGTLVAGFNPARIETLLKPSKSKEESKQ